MLHSNPSDRYTNFLRWTVFGIWILKFGLEPLQRISELPLSSFNETSLLQWMPDTWFGALLSHEGLTAIRIIGLASCLFCLSTRTLKWAGPVSFITILIHQCIVRGYGHINHAEVLAIIAVLIFVISSWTKRARSQLNIEPLAISLALCLSYTLIAAHRIAHGGIEVFSSDAIIYWSVHSASQITYFDFSLGTKALELAWLATTLKLAFPVVTIIELFSPLSIVENRFRTIFMISMLGFHIGVLIAMNIFFWENIALLIALFSLPIRRTVGKVSVNRPHDTIKGDDSSS